MSEVAQISASSVTHTLSQYIVETAFDVIPEKVCECAKVLILDSIACMAAGSTLPASRVVFELFAGMGGTPEAPVVGTNRRLPLLSAAYLNSTFANAMDYDDTYSGHPGATIIPPALAIADAQRASGRQFILAVVLAYEVALRIVAAIQPSPERWAQVSASATPQTFGAVTAAAKLFGLTLQETEMAFGLAGSNAPVPAIRKFGTLDGERLNWLKNNYAAASWAGTLGASLAARGFVGPRTILDGPRGFWVMAGSDQCDFKTFTQGLGEDYWITRVSLKPYPCCRFFHPAIDGVRMILAEHQLDIGQIREIRIASFAHLATFMNKYPEQIIDIQYSLPYSVALAAHNIPPGYAWFSTSVAENPAIAALAEKVQVVVDSDAERRFARGEPFETTVTITTDTASLNRTIGPALGDPSNPLSPNAVHAKFRSLVGPVLGEARTAALLDHILRLETLPDVSVLFEGASTVGTDSK